jgi:FkbM family methyltransferase
MANTRDSMREVLQHASDLGFRPTTVIDVGVNIGTPQLYETYPEARYILVEPLVENLPFLQRICDRLPSAEYVLAAAAARACKVVLHVHEDLAGSSVFRESDGPEADGKAREVEGIPLDRICLQRKTNGPYLIKIDTQGSEVDVISGAEEILKETELILMEACLFEFHIGGPQLHDVIFFMAERGFVVYDIFGRSYRPADGALAQVDLAFVKGSGFFRKSHAYTTSAQRREMTSKLLDKRKRVHERLLDSGVRP